MPKYGRSEFDIVQTLQNQIKDLERRLMKLENSKTTTCNIYAKSNFNKHDLMPGQLIIGKDNTLNYCTGSVDQVTVYEIQGTLYTTL